MKFLLKIQVLVIMTVFCTSTGVEAGCCDYAACVAGADVNGDAGPTGSKVCICGVTKCPLPCASNEWSATGKKPNCAAHTTCGTQEDIRIRRLTGDTTKTAGTCNACAAGTYAADDATNCAAHTTCGTQVKDDIIRLLSGESTTTAGTCAACDAGTYASDDATNCAAHTNCGAQEDTTTRLTGETATTAGTCAACVAGTYAADDVTNCEPTAAPTAAPTAVPTAAPTAGKSPANGGEGNVDVDSKITAPSTETATSVSLVLPLGVDLKSLSPTELADLKDEAVRASAATGGDFSVADVEKVELVADASGTITAKIIFKDSAVVDVEAAAASISTAIKAGSVSVTVTVGGKKITAKPTATPTEDFIVERLAGNHHHHHGIPNGASKAVGYAGAALGFAAAYPVLF